MIAVDPLLLTSVGIVFTFFFAVVVFILKLKRDQALGVNREHALRDMLDQRPVVVGGGRRRRQVVAQRPFDDERPSDDDEHEVPEEATLLAPDGSALGKKKLRKLEEKGARRQQREYEVAEREERKKRDAERDEAEQAQRELDEKLLKEREQQERLAREAKEKQELEEYLQMKEMFTVEVDGCANDDGNEEANQRQQFIDHVKRAKVVNTDELGAMFGLRASACVQRMRSLVADGALQGVFDERGKFVYITDDELNSVAKFINQRGRVGVGELAQFSNKLIRLEPVHV